MFPPLRNGSLLSNCLLVMGGAVLGSVGTLVLWNEFGSAPSFSTAAVSAVESKKSPPRDSALHRRGGDPLIKAEQILAANDPRHKADDLRNLGQEAADEDLAKAIVMADGFTNADDRLDFYRGVMNSWAARDPLAAAAYAKANFHTGSLQSESLSIVLGKWGTTDPQAAYLWAENNLSGPVKEEGINSLVQNWALTAPVAAAKWYEATGNTNHGLLTSLAGAWASNDPGAAAKWVEKLPDPKNREIGQVAIAGRWAAKNPEEAAAHFTPVIAAATTSGDNSSTAINLATVLSDIWGTTNPSAAAEWVQKLPNGPGREEAASTLATVWAAQDIQAAVKWSETLDAGVRSQVVEHLATTWGAIEPDKAIAWVQTQPGNFQKDAAAGAYNSWAGTDPVGLQDWIDHDYAGPYSDIARRSLADVYNDTNPTQAINLVLGLEDPNTQADVIGRYFRKWRSTDNAAAQEWLQTEWLNLPTGVQCKLAEEQKR